VGVRSRRPQNEQQTVLLRSLRAGISVYHLCTQAVVGSAEESEGAVL